MMPFRRILFPVDFSNATTAMVPAVKEIAQRFDSTVTILTAFNLVREYNLAPNVENTFNSEPAAIPYSQALQELRDQRKQRLEEFARAHFPNISHSLRIEDGDPAMVIEWAARHENTDLIMIPTRGLGSFRCLLLGSVTAKVLQDVNCPVLTCPHNSDPVLTPLSGYRTIICAVELNSQADEVFRAAGLLAQTYGARICLLSIEPLSGENAGQSTPQSVKRAFERALGSGGPGIGADTSVRIMDAKFPEGVCHIAIEESADLVVVGRGHSRGIFSRAWSHLYSIIRESPCAVLSVRLTPLVRL
jgi:nucleotide-binding universal stress UspA family protein